MKLGGDGEALCCVISPKMLSFQPVTLNEISPVLVTYAERTGSGIQGRMHVFMLTNTQKMHHLCMSVQRTGILSDYYVHCGRTGVVREI